MTNEPPARPRLPRILGWIAFALAILLLGPIAYAVVSLSSNPGSSGADPAAKIFLALFVIPSPPQLSSSFEELPP